jgi:cytochrome c-type biogenesis protein CcmH/NrfF
MKLSIFLAHTTTTRMDEKGCNTQRSKDNFARISQELRCIPTPDGGLEAESR